MLILPRVAPLLRASVVAGRPVPGGEIEVEAELQDGRGVGLSGTVAALLVDAHGGGSTRGIDAMDTRRALCATSWIERKRCDPFIDGDPALDPVRRAVIASVSTPFEPLHDPATRHEAELNAVFGHVLRSLEGALYQASASKDSLNDVRRSTGHGLTFNPELMTLVTSAMAEPPRTPGGEVVTLPDLLAVDPQVTYDNVARRVTRLKLFRVLAALRRYRLETQLDANEPVLMHPNLLLEKLVAKGADRARAPHRSLGRHLAVRARQGPARAVPGRTQWVRASLARP